MYGAQSIRQVIPRQKPIKLNSSPMCNFKKKHKSHVKRMVASTLEIEDKYCCNIGFDCLEKPVIEKGFPDRVYEKQIIEEWINRNPTSPFDRRPLTKNELVKPSKDFLKKLKDYRKSKIEMCIMLLCQCKNLKLKTEAKAIKTFYDELKTTNYPYECGCIIG